MNYYYERYAYNFNPREGPKDVKLRYLMKTGVLRRQDVRVGKETEQKRYRTACADAYRIYHNCLAQTRFNRYDCDPREKEVIACEHREGLFKPNQQILQRLKLGLANCKLKREKINKAHQQKYETKKYTTGTSIAPTKLTTPKVQTIEADFIEISEEVKAFSEKEAMKAQESKIKVKQEIED